MNESLGYLFADLARQLRREFDTRARAIGVTNTQWRTLKTLVHEQGCNQGALAEMLEVEPITMARMIDRLEDSGLVERRRDPEDRRAWLIYLTPAAQPLIGQLTAITDEVIAMALAGVSEDEIAQMRDTVRKLRQNLAPKTSE